MTTTTWNSSSGVGDFLDPAQWTNGAPAPGDTVIDGYGQASLSGATLDGMTIDVLSTNSTAALQFADVTFGPATLFEDFGTTNGGSLQFAGVVTNNGTMAFDASVGGLINGFSMTAASATDQFVNNGAITVTRSDGLFVTGGTLVNNGTIIDQSQRLFISSTLAGSGLIELAGTGGQGAGVSFTAPVSAGTTVDFGDALSTATIETLGPGGAAGFQATFTDFRAGDAIDFSNAIVVTASSGFTLATRTLTVVTSVGTVNIHLGGTADYSKTFSARSDGNGGFLVTTSVTAPGSSTVGGGGSATVTVTGADKVVRTLTMSSAQEAAVAAPLLAGLNPAATLFVDTVGTTSAIGQGGAIVVGPGGTATMAGGQTGLVDSATGPVTAFGNGAAGETIAAGAGNFAFTARGGTGSIVAGGGNDFLFLPGGGSWAATLGSGADTIVAPSGNDTLATGAGSTLAFLGAGATTLTSGGADTIVGQAGALSMTAAQNNAFVFALGGPLIFTAGSGADTIIGGQAGATLTGGSGTMLAFTDGATQYQGGAGADTLIGLAGSMTVQGGTGSDLVFAGFAGNNRITSGDTGLLTAFGEGNGDVITALGAATVVAAAGAGAETLIGASSTGSLAFFGGAGPDLLQAGGGSSVLVAGFGGGTLGGGTAGTVFEFNDGRTFGADTITGWSSQDFIQLTGYKVNSNAVLSNATVGGGSTSFALSDGTQITVIGVTDPTTLNFASAGPGLKV